MFKKFPQLKAGGFAGGAVAGVGRGSIDSQLTLTNPNELIVPEPLVPNFIQAAGIPDTQGREEQNNNESGSSVVEIMLQDRVGEVISRTTRG